MAMLLNFERVTRIEIFQLILCRILDLGFNIHAHFHHVWSHLEADIGILVIFKFDVKLL